MRRKTRFVPMSKLAGLAEVSAQTIYRAIEAGKIPTTKTPGGRRRIAKEDAEKFLKDLGIKEAV